MSDDVKLEPCPFCGPDPDSPIAYHAEDADGLSRLDDFMIEEILADHDPAIDEGAQDRILASLDRAGLALRKRRLTDLRAQIDRERAGAIVIAFDTSTKGSD